MTFKDLIREITDRIMPVETIIEEEEETKTVKKSEERVAESNSAASEQRSESAQSAAQIYQTETRTSANSNFAQGFGGSSKTFTRTGGTITTSENGTTSMGGVRYEAYNTSDTSVKPSLAVVKTPQLTMKVYAPTTYDDQCRQIADDLLHHNAVIVNFEGVSEVEQQRIGDFVIGAVYMISGRAEMISNKIVLYVPNGIDYQAATMASSMRRYN